MILRLTPLLALCWACAPPEPIPPPINTELLPGQVAFETTEGTFVIELDPGAAPATVTNILAYVDAGFYDGRDDKGTTIVHRVVADFVVQLGGFTQGMDAKTVLAPVVNEADNGLSNLRGTLAMARTSDPDSATSQFFVNLVDNTFLDATPSAAGYTVFGRVVDMDVLDAIGGVRTGPARGFDDVPVEDIEVVSVQRGATP